MTARYKLPSPFYPEHQTETFQTFHDAFVRKYAEVCDKCSTRAQDTDLDGILHHVCLDCGAMWTMDGLHKVFLYPLPDPKTPEILARMRMQNLNHGGVE